MTQVVVVDASLAVMWVMPEPYSEEALKQAENWSDTGARLVAPFLLMSEITNALYKRILRGEIDLLTAQIALRTVLAFGIELREQPGMSSRAITLARQLRQSTTYDCHYLALAEQLDCELWTGDQRFYRAVKVSFTRVRWIGAAER